MGIEEYTVFTGQSDNERCQGCGTQYDLTQDEDGDYICIDCLFEFKCDQGGHWI